MKHALMISILAAACGGKKPPPPAAPPPAETPAAAAPAPAVEKPAEKPAPEPPPPPPPKVSKAKVDLAPVKGQKFKAAAVTFSQQEGQQTSVGSTGWFDGLKPGTYHLVVHTESDCGPNGTKVGAVFAPAAKADLTFKVDKGTTTIDLSGVDVPIAGTDTITGHTLVLTDDKKGKPGKTLACGAVAVFDSE
jgi:hypothetical protein